MSSRSRLPALWKPSSQWLLALAIWLTVTVAGFWLAASVAGRIEKQAESNVLARAKVGVEAIEQTLGRLLEATETLHDLAQARQRLVDAGERDGAEAIETQLAAVARRGLFGVLQVAVIGPDGWLTWSSVPGWQPVYLGDREHFRVHRTAGHGLFVSEPLIGRASRRASVQFSRRLSDKLGGLAGVAIVSVDPLQLSQDLSSLEFGSGAVALIARRDGITIARSQDADHALNISLQPGSPLMRALEESPAGHFRVSQSAYDGRPKLAAYRTLAKVPLVVSIAIDPEIELAPIAFARPLLLAAVVAISMLTLTVLALALLWLERRRTQAALETARSEREAAREQLAHTHRMEALGRLAGGVAHDFNNVLQAVLGGAKGISRRSPDPAVHRLAGMITEAAERGASITRRLLAFARRGELRTEVVHLGPVLAGLREVLTHTLGAAIEVRIKAEKGLPPILADKGQLETVLVNLSVNARDAMVPLGGGTLTLSATLEAISGGNLQEGSIKPGEYLRLSVTDTGAGMDATTLARATEPFFTTKSKNKGTGLGLAMAKGFAEQSGGAFKIESTPGAGTTVTLWLPCADPQPELAKPKETLPGRLEGAPSAAVQRTRVLLVDDEPLVGETIAENLASLGWSIIVAESGTAALARLEKDEAIELLVTDLAMPGMDGLTLIREARGRRPGLPALLVTGHAGDAHAELLAATAADGPFALLGKPVSAEELSSCAEMLLHTYHASHQCSVARTASAWVAAP